MSNYNTIDTLLNTTENMIQLVNNTAHDDDTVTCTGVDWFKYNGTVCSTIYVNGNGWIGLGSNSEQLKVNRRDQKMFNLWREEGTLYKSIKFLRIRWNGYSIYNTNNSTTAFTFEVFLFSNGHLFLNVVSLPTSGLDGTNALVCTGGTKSFNLSSKQISFYTLNEDGTDFEVKEELINIPLPFYRKYLIGTKDGSTIYTLVEQTTTNEDGEEIKELVLQEVTTGLNAQSFRDYGLDYVPSWSDISGISDPKIYIWQDEDAFPELAATITAYPKSQYVQRVIDMTHESITGIDNMESEYSGNITVTYAYGSSTPSSESWSDHISMEEFMATDVTTIWETAVANNRIMVVRFWLNGNATLNHFTIHYINEYQS